MTASLPCPQPPPAIITQDLLMTSEASYATDSDQHVRLIIGHLYEAESLNARVREVQTQLDGLLTECAEAGWDGYEALPINKESYTLANEFLKKYPRNWAMPEVTVDPDGEVSFEWYRKPDLLFSVSVGATGKLSFAGIFGDDNGIHDTAKFEDSIPETVLQNIRQLYTKK